MDELIPVFVFGTLKSGFPNHHHLRGKASLGNHKTIQNYPLFLVGERFSPWLIDQTGNGEKIQGEVYLVDKATLAELDQLERVDFDDGYRRQSILVEKYQSGHTLDVWAYLKNPHQLRPDQIKAGPLADYRPEHARLYKSRESLDQV